jgi:phosphate butyryltransferase
MILKSMESFLEIAESKPKKKIVVAAAEDDCALLAISTAKKDGIADPILVGNKKKIEELASNIKFDLTDVEIIEENDKVTAAKIAVKLIRDGYGQILMKGMIGSAEFLKAVLDKEFGLRKGDLLSHIAFFEIPKYHKLIALSDAAQNINPTLDEKISIIKNAIDFFHRLGVENPKIAILSAVENVNFKMESTVHAALIAQMNHRNQLDGCIIDGPLAFDVAISKSACEHKGLKTDVGGDSDFLLVPDIVSGNVLYKSFTYFANATVAAIILGAKVPIVLTSRADTERSKLLSLALAACF